MNFKPTKYSLVCCADGHRFEDEGWTLADSQCSCPSLVRAEYECRQFVPQEHLEGLYRYAAWLPVHRTLTGSASPVTYKSKALAEELGLENLYITFSGWWPEIGAKMSTCSFKETEAYSVCGRMKANNQKTILITRLSAESAAEIQKTHPDMVYHKDGRVGIVGDFPKPDGIGTILVMTAGTSDIPVAEEAALTAEVLGNEVVRIYDVGVAGIHRLLSHLPEIMSASVIITIAGMEGALASVVGGLADCPVIAVPTSVGYGASFGGVAALLSMLNSCASGLSVVNIDNGFGAGYTASMINHMEAK